MKNTFSKDLFERYANGTCTEDEKAIVEGWYLKELKENRVEVDSDKLKAVQQSMTAAIDQELKARNPRRTLLIPVIKWGTVAAAIVLAVLFTYKFQSKPVGRSQVQIKAPTENRLVASKTENSMMQLPDGSLVILGKGSSLTLSATFGHSNSREVELKGKAFFDIKHNASKPFIIHTGKIKTVVLGTSFDITANLNSITVNVIRGKVRVEDGSHELGILTPNMQIVYNNKAATAIVKSINAAKELSWNKKDMEFNDITLKEAKKHLEERFGVTITINDVALQNMTFNTQLGADESLDHFLKSICYFLNASFRQDTKNEYSIQPLNQ